MIQSNTPTIAFSDTKPHYHILDGLRGVAAIMVLFFHIFEAFATSHIDQKINHGYLAVDFFFILSGFVIGYAYDQRIGKGISTLDFIKRRLIRLHPMVIMGTVIGGAMFYFQGCQAWDVSVVSVSMFAVAVFMNALLMPATIGSEIRGVGEMYPLNGPSWSLFFEYVGNVLYVLFIRKLPTAWLWVCVALAGIGLGTFAIFGPLGDICVGYSMNSVDITGGTLRLLFSFSVGLLLSRIFKPMRIKGSFWKCAALIIIIVSMPRIGGETLWLNGVYDTLCAVLVFPLVVYMGASGKTTDKTTVRICDFLGKISYPLYMVHYPFIYLYYAWVKNENLTFVESLPGAVLLVVGAVALAYLCLVFWDMPMRKKCTEWFFPKKKIVSEK